MFSKKQFGERLRQLRQKCGETQPVISRILGVTITQISDMENGKTMTTLEKLSLICEHYQVSADYLLGLTDDPTPHGRKGAEESDAETGVGRGDCNSPRNGL